MTAKVWLRLIDFYQRWLSPLKPPCCRFTPTCSEYARQAIATHGSMYGLYLTSRRILKCQPFHSGGYDPVPGSRDDETAQGGM